MEQNGSVCGAKGHGLKGHKLFNRQYQGSVGFVIVKVILYYNVMVIVCCVENFASSLKII